MAKKYVKIYYDWLIKTATLSSAEKGRLVDAMIEYAMTGEIPTLSGCERYLFPVYQVQIDLDSEAYQTKVNNGQKGGIAKASELKRNLAKPSETKQEKEEEKEKEKDKKNKNINSAYAEVRSMFIRLCPSLPKPNDAAGWTEARKKSVQGKSMEDLQSVFERVERSDFLTGRSGNWNGCSFDWILKPANWAKIMEGNYDNKNESHPTYDIDAFTELLDSYVPVR